MRAMNFTEVAGSEVERLLRHRDWVAEQKLDGTRALVRLTETSTDFFQRSGAPLKHTAATQHFDALRDALGAVWPQRATLAPQVTEIWLDGEILIRDGTYHVFDLPSARTDTGFAISAETPFWQRRWRLENLFGGFVHAPVHLVRQAISIDNKVALYERARAQGAEGLVLKHLENRYAAGERVKDICKVKFVKTADVVVMDSSRGRNEAGREVGSFTFGIYDPDDGLRVFGCCSAIGKPDAQVGDVIEVAYLYREPGGVLVQPRMLRVREDKAPEDCREDQFPEYSRAVL